MTISGTGTQSALRVKRCAFCRGYASQRGVRSPLWRLVDKKIARDTGLTVKFISRVRSGRKHLSAEAVGKLRANLNTGEAAALDPECMLNPAPTLRAAKTVPAATVNPVAAQPKKKPALGNGRSVSPMIKLIGSTPIPGTGTVCTLLIPEGMKLRGLERLKDTFVLLTEAEV